MLRGRGSLDPPGRLFAVDIGQREVHENEIGLLRSRHGDALGSVGSDHNPKAGARQPVLEHVDVVVVVLHVENLHATLVPSRLTHLPISRLSWRSISSRSLFSMTRSTQPLRQARSSSVSSLAVITTTGMSCHSARPRSASRNSNPSIFGIIRSRMITSGRAEVSASIASSPFSASVIFHPAGSKA